MVDGFEILAELDYLLGVVRKRNQDVSYILFNRLACNIIGKAVGFQESGLFNKPESIDDIQIFVSKDMESISSFTIVTTQSNSYVWMPRREEE